MDDDQLSVKQHPPRLAWVPIPILLLAMVALWVADVRVVWPSRPLNWLVHYGSVAPGVGLIVIPAARSFLANGQASVLMLGCGVLIMDIGVVAMPTRTLDVGFAIYNPSVLLAALCHFIGVAITTRRKLRLRRSGTWLMAAYTGGTAAMGLVIWGALTGRMPVFFLEGQGGTVLRSVVVSTTVALFLLTAGLLWQTNRRAASPFFYWYALGLVLVAAGLAGSMVIAVKDSPLHWFTRSTQFLGGIYMCVAVLISARESGTGIPLAAVEETWREHGILAGFQQQTLLGGVWRYGLALVAVAVALVFRQAAEAWAGSGLPPYITFYPVVMIVALLGGLGPGLLATALSSLAACYWILAPVGPLAMTSPADRLGLVIFAGMGAAMSVTAELYRRNRLKAVAYDREAALRESRTRLAVFAEATFEGIVESAAGRIVDCNEQYARMVGCSVAELRGVEIASLIAPEDRDRVMANVRQGQSSSIEHGMLCKDGTRIIVEAHGRPVSPDSAARHTAIRDITERKRAEQEVQTLLAAVQTEKDRLSSLIGSISDEVWFADTNRKFTLANPSAVKEFHLGSAAATDVEALAKSLEVFRGDGSPRPVDEAPPLRALAGEVIRGEEEIIRTPGTGALRHRQVSAAPVCDATGAVIGSVSVVRDITERKRAEAETQRRAEELRAANDELTRFNRVTMGREVRVIELKKQVNELCARLGLPPRYEAGLEEQTRPTP